MNRLKLNIYKNIDFLIKVELGPDAGKAYHIRPPHITLGRDSQCQIPLSDPKASRRQCMIKFDNDVVCVDLSSRKTTLVNGKPGNNKSLKPGDVISFGNTSLRFLTQTNPKITPQLTGQKERIRDQEKKKRKQRFNFFLTAMGLVVVLLFFLQDDPVKAQQEELVTQENLNEQIEESRERRAQLMESYKKKKKFSKKSYLYKVENHFISGFRDFQNGQYNRALDSFGTTIATDQTHIKAQLYSKTAKKKRSGLIETHLQDGRKYKEKMMYNRCAAEFEKAIVLMNNTNSQKYQLAKTQLNECRILKNEGYQ